MILVLTFKVSIPGYDSIGPELLVEMCNALKKVTPCDKTEVCIGPISVEAEE